VETAVECHLIEVGMKRMKFTLEAAAAAMLAASLLSNYAGAEEATAQAKNHVSTSKTKTTRPPTVQGQIEELRLELQNQAGQIDALKAGMAEKDTQLKKAEQAAADAQAAAAKAEAASSGQKQAATQNAAAVSTLESVVTVLKSNQSALVVTISDEKAAIKKAIESPGVLHYKGITLAPYGFFNGESVYRTHATGGEMPTPWSAIPYEHADAYSMSEMYISARQSRLGLIAEGKANWGAMRAYFEGDFLGVGTTSNDNQSTSYIFRQRIALAEAETNSHWTFSGGQGWTLATENKTVISTAAANMALPTMIDPNYVAGLVWARMGNIRVTKGFNKAALAISAENPQLLYTASLAGDTPYAVVGSAGLSAALMNQTISACSPSTSIVNFTNEMEKDANGVALNVAVPVYKIMNSCANMANVSFNKAPDMLVKAAFDPGFGVEPGRFHSRQPWFMARGY
jgi:hypothetical protein